jgi:hypothetical protein
MLKYLNTIRGVYSISRRNFSKKGGLFSFFGKKETEDKTMNTDNLKYQNNEGILEKVDKKTEIPENVNLENNLFEDLAEDLRERTFKNEFEGTNFGILYEKFGDKIGENRKMLIQQINNELNFDKDIQPRIDRLTKIGVTNDQISILLRKE